MTRRILPTHSLVRARALKLSSLAMVFSAISLWSFVAHGASKITGVEFLGKGDPHQILIHSDQPLTFEKQENPQDKQIVLELKDAQLANDTIARKLDTSSFDSKVSLISPYQVEGQNAVRVVIQMREMTGSEIAQDGNTLKIRIPHKGGNTDKGPEPAMEAVPSGPAATTVDHLTEFVQNRKTQNFVGKPITLQVRNADITDVFRLIGEASGFNIILGDDVKGQVTLSMVDVPWDLILETILRTHRLGAERNRNILRITTLANLTAEKQEELRAKQAAEASAPRITRLFSISYAKLEDLSGILRRFAVSSLGGTEGTIQVDNRTNSIIIQDTADNIEKMQKLIQILDTQTPQVLIEAKIVEAKEGFTRSISGSLGIGRATSNFQTFASLAGGDPISDLLGAAGSASASSAESGMFGLGIIKGSSRLNALINIGESDNQLRVVSSPKTVVLNKESATIVSGTPVAFQSTTQTQNGPIPITQIQNANLSLNVTPSVANDGSVLMKLNISRDIGVNLGGGAGGAVANRNMSTMVMVDSGSTLVIGGIYQMENKSSSSGFPFLRKIPILGVLFGSESESTDRVELLFFITPRVINEKEAGMTT